VRDDDCWTVASDRTTLVPQLLVRSTLRTSERRALAQEWSEIEPGLMALHAHAGGNEAAMAAVAEGLGATELSATSATEPADDESWRLASSLFRAVDPTPAARQFADWLDALSAGQAPPSAAAEAYGIWSRRVMCWSEVLDLAGRAPVRFAAPSRYSIIEQAAGVDSGVSLRVSWRADIGEGSAETVLLEVAMRIQQEANIDDGVTRALALAMDSEGPDYRGLAHAEAVVVLKDRREPERAWGALQSAAWWSSRHLGHMPDFVMNGGRLLAEENGWTDLLSVLERSDRRE
jgi:hypothetical protein